MCMAACDIEHGHDSFESLPAFQCLLEQLIGRDEFETLLGAEYRRLIDELGATRTGSRPGGTSNGN